MHIIPKPQLIIIPMLSPHHNFPNVGWWSVQCFPRILVDYEKISYKYIWWKDSKCTESTISISICTFWKHCYTVSEQHSGKYLGRFLELRHWKIISTLLWSYRTSHIFRIWHFKFAVSVTPKVHQFGQFCLLLLPKLTHLRRFIDTAILKPGNQLLLKWKVPTNLVI